MTQKNFLELLIEESKSYMGIDKISQLIQSGGDLKNIPLQPLYMSIRTLPVEAKGALLPRLSKEQRQAFLDIDLWHKDDLSVEEFSQWMFVYANTTDELKYEFVKSPEFALFLKARFNIWTFDVEDPQYPDHDYYFLTECNQLLFEYDEECEMVDQLKDAIKILYTEEGVENAYTYLFKIVADQIGMMSEDEYRLKKGRLQDYGFVDYYEALQLTNNYPSKKHLDNFIKKSLATKRPIANVSDELKLQRAPYSLLSPFEKNEENFQQQISQVKNDERTDFLNFNFIKLVNANLELSGGIKRGSIEVTKTSKQTKMLLELGLSYLQDFISTEYEEEFIIFDIFSFTEIYRIGKSLILFGQKSIKSSYLKLKIDEKFDTFLGPYYDQFISTSFSINYEFNTRSEDKLKLNNFKNYQTWMKEIETLNSILPFAKAFYDKLSELKENNLVQDHFYLNYNVSDIDFPTLLISSFANFVQNQSLDHFKIGLSLNEFKSFLTDYQNGGIEKNWNTKIKSFSDQFGFKDIIDFNSTLKYFINDALDGYDKVENLSDEEFKYIGGPIILLGISA